MESSPPSSNPPHAASGEAPAPPPPARTKKGWIGFILRWTIAIAGAFYIIRNISLHDTVLIAMPGSGRPVPARLVDPASDGAARFLIRDPSGATRTVSRADLFTKSEYDRVVIADPAAPGGTQKVDVLGLKVGPSPAEQTWPLVVVPPRTVVEKYFGDVDGPVQLVDPARVVGPYEVTVPYPLVDAGLINVVRRADPALLWAAVLIVPLNFLITSYRWHLLLRGLGINVGAARAFHINMVGAFWNTVMPGTTGGDLFRAYFAAKHTTHRTRAVVSVIVDRIIGLLALVILGGSMAAYQTAVAPDLSDPAARKCMQVAVGAVVILSGTVLGSLVLFNPALRKWTGMDFALRRLPMQGTVGRLVESLELYRRQPALVLGALAMSIPVHVIVVVSAMLACMAFGFRLPPWYYFVIVPVIGLAGAVPVSPQGAGVMEFFAILLTRRQGWTVSQAFILTMSMRLVQVFWNLLAGVFVLRGGYHAPPATEMTLAAATDPPPVAPPA